MKVKVTGTEQLQKVARQLTEKGNSKSLTRRMARAMKKEAKPIIDAQRASLAAGMPKSGGAAALISATAKYTVRTYTAGKVADVSLFDSWPRHNMREIDQGILRHPLFGDKTYWYTTSVPPKMLTTPFLEHKPAVEARLLAVLAGLAEEIARGV